MKNRALGIAFLVFLNQMLFNSSSSRFHPEMIASLPKSDSGYYVGSREWSTWVYRGSDEHYHHLTYSWHRTSFVRDRKFKLPKDQGTIDETFPLTENYEAWMAVTPVMNDIGDLQEFRTIGKIHPPSIRDKLLRMHTQSGSNKSFEEWAKDEMERTYHEDPNYSEALSL